MSTLNSTLVNEEHKLIACVHCGLCLDSCPTYVATGDENDSPRGRLYLMRAVAEGRLSSTSTSFERHIDRCLGCRACESVCPAGVEYGALLEASRFELQAAQPRRGVEYRILKFVLRHIWMHPQRLKLMFWFARLFRDSGLPRFMRRTGVINLLPARIGFGLALLESSGGRSSKDKTSGAPGNFSHRALLFKGCVGEGLFSRVNRATRRVLEASGFELDVPSEQICCGALHAHAGDLEGAKQLALRNIAAFVGGNDVPIVTNAGGCGAMLKSYGHLLAEDENYSPAAHQFSERVKDVGQLVVSRGENCYLQEVVTYDTSCHLMYGQHAAEESMRLVSDLARLNFVPLPGTERCCGGAGIYNLLEPELSQQVLKEKLENIRRTGAQVVATGNPGCQMQIGAGAKLAGFDIRVCHPIELLDECLTASERAGTHAGPKD